MTGEFTAHNGLQSEQRCIRQCSLPSILCVEASDTHRTKHVCHVSEQTSAKWCGARQWELLGILGIIMYWFWISFWSLYIQKPFTVDKFFHDRPHSLTRFFMWWQASLRTWAQHIWYDILPAGKEWCGSSPGGVNQMGLRVLNRAPCTY